MALLAFTACSGGATSPGERITDPGGFDEPGGDGATPALFWSPQGQLVCDEDFTRYSDWNAFRSGANCGYSNMTQMDNWGRNNVDIDRDGLMYRFRADPDRCGDQIVGQASIPLGINAREVWMEFTNKWSTNFDTRNPNCSSPAPDYKHVLFWFAPGQRACGHVRSDFKTGMNGGQIHFSAPGFPQCDNVTVNPDGSLQTVRQPGAQALWDGNWHTFRLYTAMLGNGQYQVYAEVDGQITHDYVTTSVDDSALAWRKVMLGSNRNLGATSDMFMWWRDVKIWVR